MSLVLIGCWFCLIVKWVVMAEGFFDSRPEAREDAIRQHRISSSIIVVLVLSLVASVFFSVRSFRLNEKYCYVSLIASVPSVGVLVYLLLHAPKILG